MFASALKVVRRLQDAGFQALWVGGAVRDALWGLEPKDVDVATNAPPDVVQGIFQRTLPVGARFGVLLLVVDGVAVEVATFRSDEAYVDGRHPTGVHFGTAEEDAFRRDFTINALFYDPLQDEVLDFTGGQEDLAARRLRAVGDPGARFREDALRLLRALRFAARFNLEIEGETAAAIRAEARGIRRISAERIRDELVHIFTGPHRGLALQLLHAFGLLREILPEVAAMDGVPQPKEFHPEGDVFTHTRLALDALPENPPPTLAMATLLHDVGKPPTLVHADRIRFNEHNTVGAEMAEAICRRLKFSNDARKRIVDLVRQHMRFMHIQKMRTAKLRRFLGVPHFEEHLELHRADCLSSHRNLSNYDFCHDLLAQWQQEDRTALPPPLLSGHDLIRMGYQPGPGMGELLEALREAQLEGDLETREAAEAWVREHYPPAQ